MLCAVGRGRVSVLESSFSSVICGEIVRKSPIQVYVGETVLEGKFQMKNPKWLNQIIIGLSLDLQTCHILIAVQNLAQSQLLTTESNK